MGDFFVAEQRVTDLLRCSSLNTAMPHNISTSAAEEENKCTKLPSQCNVSESGPQTLVCTEHKNTYDSDLQSESGQLTGIKLGVCIKTQQHLSIKTNQRQLSAPDLHSVLTV